MPTEAIHIIGAGGHGRVVADALICCGTDRTAIVFRDRRLGLTVFERPVVTPEVADDMSGVHFHVAIGSTVVRAELFQAARKIGSMPLTVIHPAAVVSPTAILGAGTLVAAMAIIAPNACVGEGTIVNHAAVVDHDVRIGAFCHVAPNATLGGSVTIGNGVLIGAGAVILPGLSIADQVTVGAGAVVVCGIEAAGTWVGNPAKRLSK